MTESGTSEVRERLVAAAAEVLASQGRVSMPLRAVAARAGTTTGAIQHHFGNKERLLLAVLRRHGERAVERLRQRRSAPLPPPRSVVRAILLEFLPLDEQRREEALVAHSFEAMASTDEGLAEAYAEQYAVLAGMLARHLPDADEEEVDLVLAAVGGLRTDLLLSRIDDERAVHLVDRLIDRFG